ncbi:MAG: hypothetical protein K8L97_31655 [Anaerolineae bacterium]|nr:hypothetical protein [Anaerolineae bacterium]
MENPNETPVNNTEQPVPTENPPPPAAPQPTPPTAPPEDPVRMEERLERLGGEPAPAITPEEFARLQRAGQVHIDARGRVRTARRSDAEAGVSLRKRRAWYGKT